MPPSNRTGKIHFSLFLFIGTDVDFIPFNKGGADQGEIFGELELFLQQMELLPGIGVDLEKIQVPFFIPGRDLNPVNF